MPNPLGHALSSAVAAGYISLAVGWPPLGHWTFAASLVAVALEALSVDPHIPPAANLPILVILVSAPAILLLPGVLDLTAAGGLAMAVATAISSSWLLDLLFRRLEGLGKRGPLPHLFLSASCLALFLGLLILSP